LYLIIFYQQLLLNVSNLIHSAILSRQLIEPRETHSCEGRKTAGPICESCDLLSTCLQHSNGWVNIPVESCDTAKGYYCNARLGTCSNATGPCHPFAVDVNFQCTSQGTFPDPYDCHKYHMCYFFETTLVAATVSCGNDKAFNARTGQCSLTVQSSVCTQPQYQCPHAGFVSAWPSNPNIFYVCKSTVNLNLNDSVIIYPSLHRCNDGEVFDNFGCRADSNVPMETTLRPSEDPNDDGYTVVPMRCEHVGLMADPQSCYKYYYCSGVNGGLRHMDCPVGTYYKSDVASCVLGTC
ncbi:CG13806, partial [Drosophila busckii]